MTDARIEALRAAVSAIHASVNEERGPRPTIDDSVELILEALDALPAEPTAEPVTYDAIKEAKESANRELWGERTPAEPTAEAQLKMLRALGWRVAVHNDYMQDGTLRTFWLFTLPDGTYRKGEGTSDVDAIAEAMEGRAAMKEAERE